MSAKGRRAELAFSQRLAAIQAATECILHQAIATRYWPGGRSANAKPSAAKAVRAVSQVAASAAKTCKVTVP